MKAYFFTIFSIIALTLSLNFFSMPAAYAANAADAGQGIANVLCNVIEIAQGQVGKTIATLIIISLAIGLFLGKITWGVAIAVAVGMGVLFGANTTVGFIAGGGDPCENTNQE
jgi:type IV secretion system protein VirB2